ncbi:cytochrome P450 6B1 [Bombus vancouverensis nearcticus]|uniref:Cytochrome P450 6B1-like n=1 Tax=Bombus bifarius TaxID=103933 RepID=A0A6P8NSV5_9HYME|nr:cytochrome P450 6B1-like [Bombus vancouverensis nearcticus]XP_033317485.1 cytochrome P450 6B1-like [Bombus bifarius]
MSWLMIETIGFIVTVFVLLYYYSMIKLNYWRKRGVKGPKPLPFLGNFKDVLLGKDSTTDCFQKAYNEFRDEPMVGVYGGHEPLLVLRDLDLIKDVLIKDFNKFAQRTHGAVREVEPLSEQIFRLEAERWRPLRIKLSPFFSTGKLKEMFHLMTDCANTYDKYLEKLAEKGEPIEFRDTAAKFTIDVIAACAFSIQTNAITDENCQFRKMGKRALAANTGQFLTDRLREYPFLFRIFGRFFTDHDVINFFETATREAMDYRIQNNVHTKDVIDILADLRQHPEKINLKEADSLFLASQAQLFFLAGFGNSSLTISNALYELAWNQTVQDKLREEIQSVLKKYNGEITYDGICEMKYLNACLLETLRKYPVIQWLSRTAMETYTFSGTKVTVPKGQQIFLPVYAIQKDPEIYPNPEVFDPDRFSDENIKTRHAMAHLPFGDGPRHCSGIRLAMKQLHVGMVTIVSKFKVEVCEKTRKVYKPEKRQLFLLQPADGIYLKMSKVAAA